MYLESIFNNEDTIESVPDTERGGEYDDRLGNIWDEISKDALWVTYPGCDDDVEITRNDMESIQPGRPLRDNIMDFYMRYLCLEVWGPLRIPLYVFDSLFFTQLVDNGSSSAESQQRNKAFEKVQKWTREVDIFEKDYVFIPVNQSSHWSLIILCGLSSLTSSPDQGGCSPRILHLNSVESTHRNVEGHIRSYIIHAWKERYHDPNEDQLLALSQLKYEEVKVPQQDNDYDCGIYLLHFVELFLVDFSLQRVRGDFSTGHWDAFDVSAKRREIRNLILELCLRSRRESRELFLRLHAGSYSGEECTERTQ